MTNNQINESISRKEEILELIKPYKGEQEHITKQVLVEQIKFLKNQLK